MMRFDAMRSYSLDATILLFQVQAQIWILLLIMNRDTGVEFINITGDIVAVRKTF